MYIIFYDETGKPAAVNRFKDGASLLFDLKTKTFDESHPLTIELRKWEQDRGEKIDLSDRTNSSLDLASLKTKKQQQIVEIAAQKQEILTAGYSATEQSTWDKKEQESRTFLENNDLSQVRYLAAEAAAMVGSDDQKIIEAATFELAQAVLDAADRLRLASGSISGIRARKWREVEAIASVEEVLSYSVEDGW